VRINNGNNISVEPVENTSETAAFAQIDRKYIFLFPGGRINIGWVGTGSRVSRNSKKTDKNGWLSKCARARQSPTPRPENINGSQYAQVLFCLSRDTGQENSMIQEKKR